MADDIIEVEPTVKAMRFVAMYEGFALLHKAEEATQARGSAGPQTPSLDSSDAPQRLFYLQAIEKFKDVR